MKKFYGFSLLAMLFVVTSCGSLQPETPGTVPGRCVMTIDPKESDESRRIVIEFSENSEGVLMCRPKVKLAMSKSKPVPVNIREKGQMAFELEINPSHKVLFEGKSVTSGVLKGICYGLKGTEQIPIGSFELKHLPVKLDPKLLALLEVLGPEESVEAATKAFNDLGCYSGVNKAENFMQIAGGQNYAYGVITSTECSQNQLENYYNFSFGCSGAAMARFLAMHISGLLWNGLMAEDLKNIVWIKNEDSVAEAKFDYVVNAHKNKSLPMMALVVKKNGNWIPQKLAIPFPGSNSWEKAHLIYDRSQKVVITSTYGGFEYGDLEKSEFHLQNYSGKELNVRSDWRLRCINENGSEKCVVFDETLSKIDKKLFVSSRKMKHRGLLRFGRQWKADELKDLKGGLYFEIAMGNGKTARTNLIFLKGSK